MKRCISKNMHVRHHRRHYKNTYFMPRSQIDVGHAKLLNKILQRFKVTYCSYIGHVFTSEEFAGQHSPNFRTQRNSHEPEFPLHTRMCGSQWKKGSCDRPFRHETQKLILILLLLIWNNMHRVYLTDLSFYCLSDSYSCDDIVDLWKHLIPLREWCKVLPPYDFIKHGTSILICNQILLLWKPWTLTISVVSLQRKTLWRKHPRLWSQLKKEWKMTFLNRNPPPPPRTLQGDPEKTCKADHLTLLDFCISLWIL